MNYETFADVVTTLKRLIDQQEQFILENQYANFDGLQIDKLARTLFGEHYEDVAWFLYERNERCNKIWYDDREYVINSVEDYLVYAKKEMFNE
jgi:hypothetical protein